jgi:AraC-like DNA-binding protein
MERMHAALGESWTVSMLARLAGMSRAVFARKFVEAFGLSPLQHLREERMEHAASRLAETNESLSEIARRIGFQSEWAFSRAFRRHHGVAPGTYRRQIAMPSVMPQRPRMSMAA